MNSRVAPLRLEERICRECGGEIEDFMADDREICFGCKEFFEERESRAIGWAEAMEANNERAS